MDWLSPKLQNSSSYFHFPQIPNQREENEEGEPIGISLFQSVFLFYLGVNGFKIQTLYVMLNGFNYNLYASPFFLFNKSLIFARSLNVNLAVWEQNKH